MATTFKHVRQTNVTVIDDSILAAGGMSLKSLGLYTLVVHLAKLQEQGKWNFTMAGVGSFVSDGKDSIRSAMTELEDKGFIIRATKRSDPNNRFKADDQKWVIFDNPDCAEWDSEVEELKAEGYELLGVGKNRAKSDETATPQVGAVGGFSADGESANGVGVVENSVVENSKPQVRAVGGFSADGESAANNIYIERDIYIHPSNPIGTKGAQSENLSDGRTDGRMGSLMDDPIFKQRCAELKALSINRNNLHMVDAELAALVEQGFSADEIIAEFDAVQRKLKAEGREDRYMIQLAGWLRNQAAATLLAKRQASLPMQGSTSSASSPLRGMVVDDSFDAATYTDDMLNHWQVGAYLKDKVEA